MITQYFQTVFVVWRNHNSLIQKVSFATISSLLTVSLECLYSKQTRQEEWGTHEDVCVSVCTLYIVNSCVAVLPSCALRTEAWTGVKSARLLRWKTETSKHFLCRGIHSFQVFFAQMSQNYLDFNPPPGLQAFSPRPCVASQDIPAIGFLAFMARPSSPSTTHTSFLCVCVYLGIPTLRMLLFCAKAASPNARHLNRHCLGFKKWL